MKAENKPIGWLVLADATAEAGERLVREGMFDKVMFTGGTRVGAAVAATAAAMAGALLTAAG